MYNKNLFNASLETVLKLGDVSLWNSLDKTFQPEIKGNDFMFKQNRSPICFVAHIDTVRDNVLPVVLEKTNNVIRNKNGILGADDRAGVFAILQIYKKCMKKGLPLPNVLFTDLEETGGMGAKEFCTIVQEQELEGIRLFIEYDRKGANQWIDYTEAISIHVSKYLNSFGYHENAGSYSDVFDIAETFLIPAINLSIGYYEQHTTKEYLVLDEMWLNINRGIQMVKNPIEELYPLEFIYDSYQNNSYILGSYNEYYKEFDSGKGLSAQDCEHIYQSLILIRDNDKDIVSEELFYEFLALVGEKEYILENCPDCFECAMYCTCGRIEQEYKEKLKDPLLTFILSLFVTIREEFYYEESISNYN